MRPPLIFALVFLLAAVVLAQGPHQTLVISGGVLPETCNVDDVFYKTTATKGWYDCGPANTWTAQTQASVPSGVVVLVASGSCPTGFTEQTAMSGYVLRGTTTANADIGTTGGTDSITPGGTLSWPAGVPTFTGTALGTHTHTFTGSALGTHTHTFTGSSATASATTSSPKLVTANTSSGVAPQTTATGTNASVSAGTPAGTNAAVSAGTPAGTVAWPVGVPTFSGASFDNRPAFIRVVFCKKD